MKINLDKCFADPFGNPIEETPTIGHQLTVNLFTAEKVGGHEMTSEQKYTAYRLATALAKGGEVELSAEDAAFLKRVAADVFKAGAYGQIADILDCKQD